MKKDIEEREILDFGIALIPKKDSNLGTLWDVFLVNLKETPIQNVLVNVIGRSESGLAQQTDNIRYYFPEIAALSYAQVEVMMPEVASLNNRYWVSFQHNGYLFDKKYHVPYDAINVEPDLLIPLINQVGIWFE